MATLRVRMFGQPVDFVDCPGLLDGFLSILSGWAIDGPLPVDDTPAYVTFTRDAEGHHWNAPWLADGCERKIVPSISTVDAVCDFHYEFIDWFADRHPAHLCLHAAAVRIGDGLVLFPCVQRAGKSTLVGQFAAMGHEVFGDDVVGIEPRRDHGFALGLAPRLRLPLPVRAMTSDLERFLLDRRGLGDETCMYLDLRPGEIADLGRTAPIRAICILERKDEGAAEIGDLSVSRALRSLIDQNFGVLHRPGRIFDRLRAVAEQADRYVLRYSDLRDAADRIVGRMTSHVGREDATCRAA